MDLQGTTVVVTGGGSGLGAATAKRLAGLGAKVTIFDMNETSGAELASGIGATFIQVDVSDESAVADALLRAEAANGVARVLVNCAGVVSAIRILDKDGAPHGAESFRRMIEVNLVGAFITIAQFAARLASAPRIGEERGVIVNTASIAAFDGQSGQAAYSASKAGVVGLTLPAARDLAPHGIRVASIAPGYFLTGMTDQLPETIRQALEGQPPHPRRLGAPAEFAQLVESIIANPMLNGEVIRLDAALRLPAG